RFPVSALRYLMVRYLLPPWNKWVTPYSVIDKPPEGCSHFFTRYPHPDGKLARGGCPNFADQGIGQGQDLRVGHERSAARSAVDLQIRGQQPRHSRGG